MFEHIGLFLDIFLLILSDVFQEDEGFRASLCIYIKAFKVFQRNLCISMNHIFETDDNYGLGGLMKVYGTDIELTKSYYGWRWWWCTALVFNNESITCNAPLKTLSNGLTCTSVFLFTCFLLQCKLPVPRVFQVDETKSRTTLIHIGYPFHSKEIRQKKNYVSYNGVQTPIHDN